MQIPDVKTMLDVIDTVQYHHFEGTNAIVCCIKVKNGHTFIGTAQAANNFDKQVGEATAYGHAQSKYFESELYLARQRIYEYVQSEAS